MFQKSFRLRVYPRGFHLVTQEIEDLLGSCSIQNGIVHIFIKHTSASLTINENADSSVRRDMEAFLNDTCDDKPYFKHTYEGDDDMPAHLKASLLGSSVTIPLTNGRLNLGTWQGIYLGEHRDHGGSREIVVTVMGE
ncbi:MAG: secondary thiamine-phosphate synthase enzyme YjbQ [Helicobacteraceae bacterium]|jgi:secondary thiamine-phosphate synthase enzyme|nr:secondary thiamine-phosphate synthase enzyme YjbQ [Helicobacteraceae bacterium]